MKKENRGLASNAGHPALLEHPSKLFVETTTQCNLSCPMCVKYAEGNDIGDNHMEPEFFARLEPAFSKLQALILSGIGEPLLNPHLEDFIKRARARMPETGWIGFQSNGLLLDQRRAASLVEAGLNRICLSLDALTPETFRKVRQGGEVTTVQNALVALKKVQRDTPAAQLRIGVEFVVRQDNLHELPDVIEWSAQQGAQFALVSHLMPYDMSQTTQTAYDHNTDAVTTIFEKWQQKGAEQGLDIYDYQRKAWSSDRRKHEALVALVAGMKAEARSRDIFINVRQLFERDRSKAMEAATIFAQAQEVAERHGMEIHLPSPLPRHDRNCAFVEEGGAFISWDGKVHPCYNLWHGYRCYITDWERTVTPKTFGNVCDSDILEIWNRSDFLEFRQNVLRYDYPYCSNCSVAPCDYIESEQFEQDCFVREEPCGACLWPMDLLRCLQ